jgi:hypothetical protein
MVLGGTRSLQTPFSLAGLTLHCRRSHQAGNAGELIFHDIHLLTLTFIHPSHGSGSVFVWPFRRPSRPMAQVAT